MPSLKALRNRIASVKATQKITKAMQMVAAAKLRRAQEAAVAARPYAERMSTGARQHRRLDGRAAGRAAADRRHGQGGRASPPRLRPASAASPAPSTAPSRGWRATTRAGCIAEGKTVKFFVVGRKGYDILRREFRRRSSSSARISAR